MEKEEIIQQMLFEIKKALYIIDGSMLELEYQINKK